MSAERRAYILRLLRRSRNKIILILLLIISLCLFPSSIVSAASKGKNVGYTDPGRTIRVGFYPLANGQVSYDDGTYGGYYFDYLQEIAQYTGWNYAYVKGSFDECYKMMQDGKINLMCGLNKTDERAGLLISPMNPKRLRNTSFMSLQAEMISLMKIIEALTECV